MSIDLNIIAAALKVSKRAAEIRANRENWTFSTVPGRGGQRKIFVLANLPRDVSKRVEIHQRGACASKELAVVAQVRAEAAAELQATRQKAELSLRKVAEVHAPGQQARFDSRYTIVKSWEAWYAAHPMGKKVSYWAYANAFNANEIDLDVALLQKYQPLQGRSVEHWVLKYNKEGMSGLIDGWTGKARKDVNVFTTQPELEKTAIAILIERPTITMKTLTDLLGVAAKDRESGGMLFNAPSYFATTRFCNAWKQKNEEFFMASVNPDEWKNKRMVAFGDASEGVERLNQRWEMDATPADWMLKTPEGGLRRYSVSVIIDVYSRRAIMVLSPTPRAETHKLALRLALLSWGVPEEIVTDNGKDYISRDFVGTLRLTDDLGQIVVYHEGKFVCIARCPERTGINRQELAAKARQVQRHNIAEQRKAAKTKKVNTDELVDMLLRDNAEAAGKLATLPKASISHSSTGLTAAGEAARVLDGVVAKTEVPAELRRLIDKRKTEEATPVKQAAVSNVSVIPETPEHRFNKWLGLEELLKNGGTIDDARLTRWYGSYQQTPEFAAKKRRMDEGKEKRNTAATVLRLNGTTNKQG
ncbi:integrase catalytic domain-containing protein [Undibacterium sp. TC9W]|uniref:integrase catalytic domain-containing protein n=1 Tax=Undibacterium sp. TC9W TaxID=3413053 RepID=UPI003BEF72DC